MRPCFTGHSHATWARSTAFNERPLWDGPQGKGNARLGSTAAVRRIAQKPPFLRGWSRHSGTLPLAALPALRRNRRRRRGLGRGRPRRWSISPASSGTAHIGRAPEQSTPLDDDWWLERDSLRLKDGIVSVRHRTATWNLEDRTAMPPRFVRPSPVPAVTQNIDDHSARHASAVLHPPRGRAVIGTDQHARCHLHRVLAEIERREGMRCRG